MKTRKTRKENPVDPSFRVFRVFISASSAFSLLFHRLNLWLIRLFGRIVPRHLREDWVAEWEAELTARRERLLSWQRLDAKSNLDLWRRSTGALRDALLLQPRRLEEEMVQDLVYGARILRRQPGFSFIVIATLGLGIGANAALFSVVNGVLLRPLPYPQADRLVRVWEDPGGNRRNHVNPRNYADWRDRNGVFERVAAIQSESFNLTDEGEPERIAGARVTGEFFRTLGVEAALGRAFSADEDQAGREAVVVLSHRLWQRRFGGDRGVLGRRLDLSGASATIIGVMPEGFRFPAAAELWMPKVFTPNELSETQRGSHYLATIARLRPQTTVAQAGAEIDRLYAGLREQYPDHLARWRAHVVSLHDDTVGAIRPVLLLLLGAVFFVLLIACVNVASLLLARVSARNREMAVRSALGAGRFRLLRLLLTESLLLAILGGAGGLFLGELGIRLLVYLEPQGVPRLDEIALDGRVFAFTLAASLLAALLSGLAPAWQGAHSDLQSVLKAAGPRAGLGRRQRIVRQGLVVVEIAMSLVLLLGAGLMLRSLYRLGGVETGFRADGLLTMSVTLPAARYREAAQQSEFYRATLDGVRRLPGVESAAFVSDPPVSGSEGLWSNRFDVEGRPVPPPGERLFAYLRWITPDYFQTLKIPLRRGRLISQDDIRERPWVVVIDEATADRFFPGEDPLGKKLMIYAGRNQQPREIVGVVGRVRATALDHDPEPHLYVPYSQTPLGYGTLVVRTAGDAVSLASAVKGVVREVDREQPVYHIRTMEQLIAETTADRRLTMLLLGIFAAVALLLAVIGVYGVVSYAVAERRHEIGVRMALGAGRRQIVGMVVGEGGRLAGAGIIGGWLAALGLTRFLGAQLYGVSAHDPLTYAALAGVLLGAALLACWAPARRATRVNPITALKGE